MVSSPEKQLLFSSVTRNDFFTAAAAVLIPLISIVVLFFWKGSSERSKIPGKLGLPFIGETLSLLSSIKSSKGCYDFVRLRRLRHGSWFKTRIFGKIHVFIPSAEGAKAVFVNEFVHFDKGMVKSMADVVGPKSVASVPEESHKRIRRLLSEPFSMNSLSKFVTNFDQLLCKRLKKLQENGCLSFSTLDFTTKITFDAISEMLMSITEDSLLRKMEKDCHAVSIAMLSLPLMFPGTLYYKGIKARKRLMKMFKEIITSRRRGMMNNECHHKDFLQSMLERDGLTNEEKLNEVEIMDNLLTLLIGGHSTTPAAMSWSIKYLHDYPQEQEKLREEQLLIAKKNLAGGKVLSLRDINSMSYGLKVVKETLRMCNVLVWFPKVALTDCNIDGREIKKGWHVNVDATCIHHDPNMYKDPMQFNPARFDEMQKPYSFIPFGAGPRICLGMNMAKLLMLVLLHRLTSGYRWTVDDLDPGLEPNSFIPKLRSGCPITITPIHKDKAIV